MLVKANNYTFSEKEPRIQEEPNETEELCDGDVR